MKERITIFTNSNYVEAVARESAVIMTADGPLYILPGPQRRQQLADENPERVIPGMPTFLTERID